MNIYRATEHLYTSQRRMKMITVLSVTDKPPKNLHEKIQAFFHPYSVSATQVSEKNLSLLHIRYQHRHGRIRFKKISHLAVGSSKEILCSPHLNLNNTPFVRFENQDLTQRFFFNALRFMLKNLDFSPEELSPTLYDPEGKFAHIAELLLQYAVQVSVITDAADFYEKEAQRCMNTFGASLRIQAQPSRAISILISPCRINQPLPLESGGLTFTPYKPIVRLNGLIFDKITVELPPPFERLKPAEIDSLTFLSAFYSLEFCHELGKLMPSGFEICNKPYTLAQCINLCQKYIIGHPD